MNATARNIARPWPITAAFWLYVISLLFVILGVTLGIIGINSDEGRAALERAFYDLPADQRNGLSVDEAVNSGTALGTVMLILLAVAATACALLTAFLAINGRKAARVLAVIFAVVGGIIVLLLGFNWAFILVYLLFLTATIFLWLPLATEYFEKHKEARIMQQQYPGYSGQQQPPAAPGNRELPNQQPPNPDSGTA